MLARYSTWHPLVLRLSANTAHPFRSMKFAQANDCCNKSAAFYICDRKVSRSCGLLIAALHNWLYDKWLKPYRNDIEYGQFIAKIIKATGIPTEDTPVRQVIDKFIAAHGLICNQVEEIRQSIIDQDPNEGNPVSCFVAGESFEQLQQHQQHFILQPLFRAIIIIIDTQDYDDQVLDLSQIPVYICTSIEDSLISGPIDLTNIEHTTEAIRDQVTGRIKAVCTTLDAAVCFLRRLEARESAFGVQPSPIAADEPFRSGYLPSVYNLPLEVKALGRTDIELKGPSSRWVDTKIYTEWIGSSTNHDVQMRQWEDDIRRGSKRIREYHEADARGECPDIRKLEIPDEGEEILERIIQVDQGDDV